MASDRHPSLPPISRTVFQEIGNCVTGLTTRAKTDYPGIPDCLARLKGANLPKPDLPMRHCRCPPACQWGYWLVASYHLATNFAQFIANCGKGPQTKMPRFTRCSLNAANRRNRRQSYETTLTW